jgi:outer membrane protein TolC
MRDKATILRRVAMLLAAAAQTTLGVLAQMPPSSAPTPPSSSQAASAAVAISLDEAIHRARTANSAYISAVTDASIAKSDSVIARSTLLPGIVYHNTYLYTQGQPGFSTTSSSSGSTTSSVRFIANNTIHEYISLGTVTETLGGQGIVDYHRSLADAAAAKARLEVARRGLVSTVIGAYYGLLDADQKVVIAQRALDEANRFNLNSRQREKVGEVAHADVIKGDLQQQQRLRDLNDVQLVDQKARLDLGVLLFPDPMTPYTLTTDLKTLPPLPDRAATEAAARANNPDLRAAMEALQSAKLEVTSGWFGFVPNLTVQYFYGIDAPQFAVSTRNPDGTVTRNLGYSASATLDIPVWDWFATHEKVKQGRIHRDQAQAELTITQRQLIASLQELYSEASVTKQQLTLLDQSVDTAAESLRLTNLRYNGGEGSVLEVVDAQNSLVAAEQARADGAAAYFTALANLQTLTGNLP